MLSNEDGSLSSAAVLDAFRSMREATDNFVVKNKIETYCSEFIPRSDELAIAIFCNAFEELGCPIRSAAPGTKLERIKHLPRHEKLIDYMYGALEKNAGLIETNGEEITRTSVACPSSEIEDILEDLLDDRPAQEWELGLMQRTGGSFAKCLSGKADPLQLLFGSDEGRTLMTNFYAKSPLFSTILQQLAAFMEKIGSTWPKDAGPLRVLEVGAGTGGTTFKIVPVLARLGIPVVYTMSDISSVFVSAAQKKLEEYPFVEYKVVDIEKEPDATLQKTQHIVLGSNVLHATRDLSISLANIRKMLRPDGFTIFHELTAQMLWADVAFGLISGWWAFEDGRQHALQSPQYWEKVLSSVGFGHVGWNDGHRPETKIQNLIFAMASC
ncbi:methyltransferase domain-containing protein [Zopfia rhizophila CBS 207.26]|uniref:Methyltransferase domain-containing protein n=1 Tax=Zopfia rhizophila CBS 207.26 TaxID=1314779 RepID=A0A6A6DFX9_9PEZI|nr:methyltransferase domain-containing protein [Zopfia rhizophila CBS 207.26]